MSNVREIKFRAWFKGDAKNGPGWIQGFNLMNFHDYFTKGIEPMLQRYDRYWGKDEYILMQYTGLKDKNGKEIYEGDILKVHIFTQELGEGMGVTEGEKEWAAEIGWQPNGYWLQGNTEENSGYLIWFNGLHEESFEIIGNIYQNPELTSPNK